VNCYPLAYTGINPNIGLILILAIGALLLGTAMVLATRRRRRRTRAAAATLTVLSIALVAFVVPPTAPAQASGSDCGASGTTTNNSLTVMQTSTMNNLAPGRAPVAITGLVVNNSLDSTYIRAVKVEITSVTIQHGSYPGTCDASDYFLLNTRMRVEQPLGPGGSTPFTGASIGFRNKPTNQDACQHAVIHLLYTANPD
jgi:LPXTG-motif cell wall-anchored protein